MNIKFFSEVYVTMAIAGGYKVFGPTYNSTKYVRFGHEGTINSLHEIADELVPEKSELIDIENEKQFQLAGKIVGLNDEGKVVLASATVAPVGLAVDDLGDIANSSNKVSFYFRGGEYYIAVSRMGDDATTLKPGDTLTVGENGVLTGGSDNVVAVVTKAAGVYTTGNMYTYADTTSDAYADANGGLFVGISLRI
jgi:hypothetical protein